MSKITVRECGSVIFPIASGIGKNPEELSSPLVLIGVRVALS